MPRDLFAEMNVNVDQPRDLLAEKGINPNEGVDTFLGKMPMPSGNPRDDMYQFLKIPRNKEEQAKYDQEQRERSLGALQSLANYPIEIVNLFKQEPINKFNFAPHTEQAERGALAGDIASFFMPGKALEGIGYTAKAIPVIGDAVKATVKGIEKRPFFNAMLKLLGASGEAGLYSAAKNPENAKEAGAEGAGLGVGANLLSSLLPNANPLISLGAKAGLGYLAGQPFGHGATGALVGAGLPLKSLMGIESNPHIAQDVLKGLEPKDIMKSVSANRRLGTTVTPGEASGNYVTAAKEGALKRTEEGARLGFRNEEMQKFEQQNAFNKMLDKIYKPTQQNKAMINALYEKAEQFNVNPRVIEKIRQNPIMDDAFKTVKKIPAYQNIPENNYKFLAEVDRQLQRDKKAADLTRPNESYAISETKNAFNNFLKQANSDYEAATKAAQPKIVRENIEKKVNKNEEDITAKNVYSKLFNSRKSYRELLKDTRNFPEAQSDLKDMRAGWKNFANMKTTSQGEFQAKTALDHARNMANFAKTFLKNVAGAKGDVRRLNYIYGKKWEHDFEKIAQMKDQSARNKAALNVLFKMGIAAGLSNNESMNFVNMISQGSDDDSKL